MATLLDFVLIVKSDPTQTGDSDEDEFSPKETLKIPHQRQSSATNGHLGNKLLWDFHKDYAGR